jgi:DNA-binding CsgD family transcriptional regulator
MINELQDFCNCGGTAVKLASPVLRDDVRTGSSRQSPIQRLVGREAELSQLRAYLEGARQGSGGAVVVRSEAGLGKTSVVEAAVDGAIEARVLRCAGFESEVELDYAGLHQLAWPLLDTIEALPDVQAAALRGVMGRSDAPTDRRLVGMALLTLLSEAAKRTPLIIVIEDAPLLDKLTADALVFVARRLTTESIAMVFEARSTSIRDFSAPGLPELTLAPLTDDAAAELLEHQDAEIAPLVKQRLIAESGGNPLALIELCKALSTDERRGRDRLPVLLPPTAHLKELFRERLRPLPDGTRRLLLIAASEPSGDLPIVLAAARLSNVRADAIRSAEETGLIRVDDQRIRFSNPSERSVTYAAASFEERMAAHRALAAVLPEDDRRVWHLAAATSGQDEELATALERSAVQARERRGPAVEAAALERAAALSANEESRARRLGRSARAALDAGHFKRAHALLDDAERVRPERHIRAEIDLCRGLEQFQTATLEEAPAALIRSADDVADTSAESAAMMLATAARISWLADDEASLDEVWESIARLPLADDSAMKQLAMCCAGPTMHRRVELPGGIFQAPMALSEGTSPNIWAWLPIGAADMAGELVAAQRAYRRLVVSLSTSGVVGQLTTAWTSLALAELGLGRWTDAAMHASEALRMREMGDVGSTGWGLVVLSRIAGAQGRAEECRALAAEATRLASDHGAHSIASFAAWAVGSLEMSLGHHEEAYSQLANAARPEEWPARRLYAAQSAVDLVEACVRTDRLEIANRVVEAMEQWVGSKAPAWAQVAAHRGRAMLSAGDRALAEFDAAVSISSENNHAFELAQTHLQYGESLRRQRLKTEARRQLRTALEMFARLDAHPWVGRAQAELRATGVSVASKSEASVEQLTPQELQIARLGAQGLSNREIAGNLFLSPRTVGFHLSNVFGKLGIASRSELRRIKVDYSG